MNAHGGPARWQDQAAAAMFPSLRVPPRHYRRQRQYQREMAAGLGRAGRLMGKDRRRRAIGCAAPAGRAGAEGEGEGAVIDAAPIYEARTCLD